MVTVSVVFGKKNPIEFVQYTIFISFCLTLMHQLLLKSRLIASVGTVCLALALGCAQAGEVNINEAMSRSELMASIDELILQEQWTEAEKAVSLALKQMPESAQLRFKRAVIAERSGQTQKAVQLLKQMIQRYPEIPEPYNNLAAIYAAQGKKAQARDCLTQAVRINPNFALGWENLGNMIVQDALPYYEKAAKAAPDNRRLQIKLRNAQSLAH